LVSRSRPIVGKEQRRSKKVLDSEKIIASVRFYEDQKQILFGNDLLDINRLITKRKILSCCNEVNKKENIFSKSCRPNNGFQRIWPSA
jgi:hypothetical protein